MKTSTPANLTRYAWLASGAAVLTMLIKTVAWQMTGSVGLLSDAMESFVNLAGSLMALWMLSLTARPADSDHAFGHDKAEYFSSGFEGVFILLAAVSIGYAAIERFFNPQLLGSVTMGLGVSIFASIINFLVARILSRAGRRHRSIILEADAQHLMTDVWSSIGVIVGVGLASETGILWLDPAVALVVAIGIVRTGWILMQRSIAGLMDASLPPDQLEQISTLLESFRCQGLAFHTLQTRQAGHRSFFNLHVHVPGDWTVRKGHDYLDAIETKLLELFPGACITLHMEPTPDDD
ncbi:MAG: cation transporter [Magnetococcales bacterium]|nr:cation transporter [Magnetococcales bacterium]